MISLSSLAFGFCPDFGCVVVRASSRASVSLVRGLLSLAESNFSSVPGVHGDGNLPGQLFGMPLLLIPLVFPSLSSICDPNETVFLPLLAVPGVIRMPALARLVGDWERSPVLGAGSSVNLAFTAAILALVSNLLVASLRSSGAGVPKIACLKALTANWWAGVSGGSMKVDS